MENFKDRLGRTVEVISKKIEGLGTYDLVRINDLPELNGIGLVLSHKKNKARVSVILNDDDNKVFAIGFRTPPTNSKGIQHIVEHTVLCGSKKYPVKDPFVELAKGSLNTFLNAMTYGDKTVYPIASCNDKDFRNLMDVYLDAVFSPNIYDKEEIFKQEGWHYELDSLEGDITINGVVYNEMRGVYSSPDNVLANAINELVYPDTAYGVDSGGNPDVIPELTREEYLDYHRNYYHPSNSYIYLYGDLDVVDQLEYIDKEYLHEYDYLYVPSEIKLQAPPEKPIKATTKYSITQDEAEDSKSIISYNVVTGLCTDKYLTMELSILQRILIDSPGAPLKKAIIDSGLCSDVESQYDNSMLQPLFSIIVRDADAKDADKIVDIIESNIRKYIEEGLDKEAIESAINISEFKYKEGDFARYPKGLSVGLTDFTGWLYDDELVQDTCSLQEVFDKMRTDVNFEDILKKWVLENNFKAIVVAEPEVGINSKKDAELAEKLRELKASLSKEELEAMIADTKHLKQYQDEPSTQEELSTIPLLEISDINPEPRTLYNRETEVAGAKVIAHDIFTNGITYLDLYFDISDLDFKDICKMELMVELLKYVDTDNYAYNDLTKKIDLKTGGMAFNMGCFHRLDMNPFVYVQCKMKALDERIPEGLALMEEIITKSHIFDKKRIRETINEIKAASKIALTEGGHITSKNRALSYIDPSAKIMDSMDGIDYHRYIDYLDKNFDKEIDGLIEEMKSLYKRMFRRKSVIISYTSDKDEHQIEEPLKHLLESISEEEPGNSKMQVPLDVKNEGFKTSSKVQYASIVSDYKSAGLKYDGALNVLRTIMSYDYLWINVRVKGGAYGSMCDFNQYGYCTFSSYRDPNLRETYDIYRAAADYVENFECSDRDMTKYIIGTMSNVDMPVSPNGLGALSFAKYISNTPDEFRVKTRREILTTDQARIRSLAPFVRTLSDSQVLCTVGGEDKMSADADLFKTVEKLI